MKMPFKNKKPGSLTIAGNLNQADDISVKSKSLIKGIKGLVVSKSSQNMESQRIGSQKGIFDLTAYFYFYMFKIFNFLFHH